VPAAAKEFRIKESARFEGRLDTFIKLNHTEFDTINSS
jgi:hypothetical protein